MQLSKPFPQRTFNPRVLAKMLSDQRRSVLQAKRKLEQKAVARILQWQSHNDIKDRLVAWAVCWSNKPCPLMWGQLMLLFWLLDCRHPLNKMALDEREAESQEDEVFYTNPRRTPRKKTPWAVQRRHRNRLSAVTWRGLEGAAYQTHYSPQTPHGSDSLIARDSSRIQPLKSSSSDL